MVFKPRVEKVEYYACAEEACAYHSTKWSNGCSRYWAIPLCRGIVERPCQPEERNERQFCESRRDHKRERYEMKGALGELQLRMDELATMMRDVSYLMDKATSKIPNDKGRGINEDEGQAGAAE